ncbi:acylphosphatase family [Trifolium repens]|nr:acylphosphatase family [Trifolium repens]
MAIAFASTAIRVIQQRPKFIAHLSNSIANYNTGSRIFHFRYKTNTSSLQFPLPRSLSVMASSQDSSSTKTERVVIKGRVQGVFYRNWTVDNARELGLKGWVRNRRDGSVEAVFSGSPDAVQEMEQRCRRGPRDAVVTGLEVFPGDDDVDPGTGFQRKPTV